MAGKKNLITADSDIHAGVKRNMEVYNNGKIPGIR